MPTEPDPLARACLTALAALQAALGGAMVLAPGWFTENVAAFGARNDHLLRDMASWELALAAVAALAISRPAWRGPVVALALVHFALHAVNHLVDVADADPAWLGPFDLVSLALAAGALAWLLRRVQGRPA